MVRRIEGDALLEGVIERLAVILRNRGILVDIKRSTNDAAGDGVEILRWRPPTSDPALALLSLARLAAISAMIGTTRAISSSALISINPGRVDCPPMRPR